MAKTLSLDLRERIGVALVEARESHPLIAVRFQVSKATVERIARKIREGRSLEPVRRPGRTPLLGDRHFAYLRTQLEKGPFMTSYDLTRRFNKRFPKNRVHRSTILRAMHQLNFSFKKNSLRSST